MSESCVPTPRQFNRELRFFASGSKYLYRQKFLLSSFFCPRASVSRTTGYLLGEAVIGCAAGQFQLSLVQKDNTNHLTPQIRQTADVSCSALWQVDGPGRG